MHSSKVHVIFALALIGSIVSVLAEDDAKKLNDEVHKAFIGVFGSDQPAKDPVETQNEIKALKSKLEAAHSNDQLAWGYVNAALELADTQEKGDENKMKLYDGLLEASPADKYPKLHQYLQYYRDEYCKTHGLNKSQ